MKILCMCMLVPLIALFAPAAPALAHGDSSGNLRVDFRTVRSGASNGQYQYQGIWSALGTNHAGLLGSSSLEQAATNLGPWNRWTGSNTHYGDVFPLPLHSWHRVKVCFRVQAFCIPSVTSAMKFVPAEQCSGGGGGGGRFDF